MSAKNGFLNERLWADGVRLRTARRAEPMARVMLCESRVVSSVEHATQPVHVHIHFSDVLRLALFAKGRNALSGTKERGLVMKLRTNKRRPFRRDAGDAFLPDPASGTFISAASTLNDDEPESMAGEFIASITSADCVVEEARNELSMDEIGGPYIEESDEDLDDLYD